eukprot:TRINITY_DN68251_c0_g1_i1.p1 TRINITY_DN68251_c0_g1~~TRINITY_DN68251_c0_g1_i1.p1  ORF type:complete len:236 (+),score=65.33 TRINITY_DN68251_c0_g1_i1:48-755(+)
MALRAGNLRANRTFRWTLFVGLFCVTSAIETCVDMYKTAFKKQKGQATPKEVPGLFLEYCKKNMKMSSAKSMDDLCAPMVKKVEEKMSWVPPDTTVTPELVCKTVEKIKEAFPDYAATAVEREKSRSVEKENQKELVDKAKALQAKMASEMKALLAKSSKDLAATMEERLRHAANEALDGFRIRDAKPTERLLAQMREATELSNRGVETKLMQKLEESIGTWIAAARKDAMKTEL